MAQEPASIFAEPEGKKSHRITRQTVTQSSQMVQQSNSAPVRVSVESPEQILIPAQEHTQSDEEEINQQQSEIKLSGPKKRGRKKSATFTQQAANELDGPKQKRAAKKKAFVLNKAVKNSRNNGTKLQEKEAAKIMKYNQHLENRFSQELRNPESYFGSQALEWIKTGLAVTSPDLLREMRARHADEILRDDFFKSASGFVIGSQSEGAKKMRETDGLSLLELCFRMIPDAARNQDNMITLFQTVSKVLDGFVINEHDTLDYLSIQPSLEVLEFMEKLWVWTISVPGRFPKPQVIYLCVKWEIGCKMAQLSYAKHLNGWGKISNIQNAKWKQPSSKKKHMHVSDLFWAIAKHYDCINSTHLKLIFHRTKMMLHEEVLKVINRTNSEYVGTACAAVARGCIEVSHDISPQLIELVNLLVSNLHLQQFIIRLTPSNNEKKIDLGNMLTVAKALAGMDEQFANKLCMKYKDNIHEVLKFYAIERDNREQEHINQKMVDVQIEKMNMMLNDDEQAALKHAEEASKWLVQQYDGVYRRQALQMHMIAKITGTKSKKWTLSEHPPGTGKSWIAALLVAYYHLKSKDLKFLILTCNELLKEQLQEQLNPYLKSINVQYGYNYFPNAAAQKNLIVIIDEFDSWVEQYAVQIDGKGLKGLYSFFGCTKIHMLTATATVYSRDIHHTLMKGDIAGCYFEFDAKEQLADEGRLAQQHILISKPGNQNELIVMFHKFINDEQKERPVIIFVEQDEQQWFDELNAKYSKDIEVIHIKDVKQAIEFRGRDKNKLRGIYVIAIKFARGYDLKLAKDASVLVLAYDEGFPWSMLNQMFGRGSRSFGVSRGFYFTSKFPDNAEIKDQLVLKEKKFYDAHKIIDLLFETYTTIDFKANVHVLCEAFRKERWHVTTNEFETLYPTAYELIAKQQIAKLKAVKEVNLAEL